jgi:hypothetical protein
LKPQSATVLVWNERKIGVPYLDEYERFLQRFGTDYHDITHIDPPKLKAFFNGMYQTAQMDNVQEFDFDGLKGRLLSSSYIPKPSDATYLPMLRELETLFAFYEHRGKVKFEMDTLIFWGRLAD